MKTWLKLLKPLACASLLCAGAAAQASGGYPGGGSSSTTTIPRDTSNNLRLYNAGKGVYARELACDTCAYGGRTLNAQLARTILADKESFGALDGAKQQAVREYFRQRFRAGR